MIGKLLASQFFGVAAAIIAAWLYSGMFAAPTPLILPVLSWFVASLTIIVKL